MTMMQTMQAGYQPLRTAAVTADDTTLDGVTSGRSFRFLDMPDEAVEFGPEVNACEIYFEGTTTANTTFTWRIYAYRPNGNARYTANGTGALGTAVAENSRLFADTLTITAQEWLQPVGVIDGNGNDRISSLAFDLCGHTYLYVEITDVGDGGEAVSIQPYVSYF